MLTNAFSDNIDGWEVWSPYGNGRIDWDNTNRLDGGSLRFSFASASNQRDAFSLAVIGVGAITKGKVTSCCVDGIASAAGKRVQVYLRQLSGTYSDLTARSTYILSAGRQAYEATFTATADEPNAVLVVQVEEDGQTAWLDNIRLQEVTLTAVNPDDYIKLVYNPTFQNKVQPLDGVYRDAKNTVYTNQITVAPFSSVVLMKEINTTSALRDPENPANAVTGLDYQYYEGFWDVLPDFSNLMATRTGMTPVADLSVRERDGNYGLRFNGYLSVPADGTYTFYVNSDDGGKLMIGTTEVVNNDGLHPAQERSGQIGLKAGVHAFTIAYMQRDGLQTLNVSYEGPTINRQLIPASAYYRVPPTTPSTSGIYLSDLSWRAATNGSGPIEKDRSSGEAAAGDGRVITLNGTTYAKGLGVHANSSISYDLNGQYTTFITDIGLDDEMSNPSCGNAEFQIFLDNVLVYSSGNMNVNTTTQSIALDVSGKQVLTLVVTDGGDGIFCDHADWAGARLITANKTSAVHSAATSSARIAALSEDEAEIPLLMKVYPVPAQEHVWIRYYAKTAGSAMVQLINNIAQPILQTSCQVIPGENLIKVEVGQLNRGSYVLTLVQGQQKLSHKLILSE